MQRVLIQAHASVSYFLVLNPMMGSIEGQGSHGPFPTKEAALAFLDGERVKPYQDQGVDTYNGGEKSYLKTFRKGGPLEWFNDLHPTERDAIGYFGHGVHEVYTDLSDIRVIG